MQHATHLAIAKRTPFALQLGCFVNTAWETMQRRRLNLKQSDMSCLISIVVYFRYWCWTIGVIFVIPLFVILLFAEVAYWLTIFVVFIAGGFVVVTVVVIVLMCGGIMHFSGLCNN